MSIAIGTATDVCQLEEDTTEKREEQVTGKMLMAGTHIGLDLPFDITIRNDMVATTATTETIATT